MTHLTLAFLGTFRVALGGTPITGFKSDKVRALLAYLAVEADRPHRRDVLAGLLWPEWNQREALANLRYTLYDLRKTVDDHHARPPYLLIDRNTLQFNVDSDYSLDVTTFCDLVTEPADAAALRKAIDLHQGTFLAGLSLSDAPPFEEWTVIQRERLNRKLLESLQRLITYHREQGDYEAACRYLEQQLEMEPWREEAHRQLMRLLAQQERRNAALRQYQICRQVLSEELDVAPTKATTALYERIRNGALTSSTLRPTRERPPSQDFPLVDREDQIARLHRHLDRANAGEGHVVFITGEAGSGKTALIQSFVRRALPAHLALVAAFGCCNAHAGKGDPYLPFRELLQQLTADIEAKRTADVASSEQMSRLQKLLPETAAALLDAGPDLIDRFISARTLAARVQSLAPNHSNLRTQLEAMLERKPTRSNAPAALPRQDLFEQITRVLQHLARRHTLLLVLDDLQWADAGSVALLFHLGRRLSGSRILVVGAYRPGDLATPTEDKRHPLALVAHELQREFGDIQIDLDALQGRSFVEALLNTEPNRLSQTFRETLARRTGGNPLFTVELLRGLQERADLVQDAAGRWIATGDLAREELPARVEAVIAERVERLPATWRETLRIASVEGESFTAEVVARVQGVDEQQMEHRLSGPLSLSYRLIQPQGIERRQHNGQVLSRYRFRHIVFQRYLYESLNEVTRQSRHEAVGETLEELYGGGTEEIALQLARHFEEAGRLDRAVVYLHAAGKHAYLLSAAEQAISLFMRGLSLLAELPDTPERRQQELQLQLALTGPLLAQRGWGAEERAEALTRAHALAEHMDSTPELLQALFVQADLSRAQGNHARSLELGQQMLEMALRSDDREQIALAHWTLGETQLLRAAFPEARTHLVQGIWRYDANLHRHLTSITGPNVGVTCMTWLSWALWMLGYPDQALGWVNKALALAEQLDHSLSLAFALAIGAAGLHLLRREPEAAAPYTTQLSALVADQELAAMQPWVEILLGVQQARKGALEAGIAQVRRGIAAWSGTGAVSGRSFQLLLLVNLYQQADNIDAALETVDEALTLVEETGERTLEAEHRRLKGTLQQAQGMRTSEVETYLRATLKIAQQQSARAWALRTGISLAQLLRDQERNEAARRLLTPLYDAFTEGFDTPDLQEAQALLQTLKPAE